MTYKIETNNFDYPLFIITIKEDKLLFSIENAEGKGVLSLVMPFTKAYIRNWILLLTGDNSVKIISFISTNSTLDIPVQNQSFLAKFLQISAGQIWQFIYKEGIFELAPEN